jgi:hypothetical protein
MGGQGHRLAGELAGGAETASASRRSTVKITTLTGG